MKEIEINMVVTVPENVTEDQLWNKFIEFVESNNWSAGGIVKELTEVDNEGTVI